MSDVTPNVSHPRTADPFQPSRVDFQSVSSSLTVVRMIGTSIVAVIVAAIVTGAVLSLAPSAWWAVPIVLIVWLWRMVLIPAQVRAIGFAQAEHDFIIRGGIMFKYMCVIPYGRIQYVDVNQGPVARLFGIATITIHTASPGTSGTLHGVPMAAAAQLRDTLAARGTAEMAGL